MPNKNWKIRVNSPEHSVKVQEALFKISAKWLSGDTCVKGTTLRYLYITSNGIMGDNCKAYFSLNKSIEMFLQPDGTFAEQEFKQQQGERV